MSVGTRADKYRWVIIVAGICGLFASLGIGRFSLGMLLPAMGEELQLSYSQMGTISTLNFCGYLGAVLLCGKLVHFLGARLLISLALLLVGASMVAISFTEHLLLIMLLYCLTGIGSALANVPIMALVSTWFEPSFRGRAMGMIVIGNGLGIVLTGRLVPVLNGMQYGWQLSWLTLGAMVLCLAVICWLMFRNKPAEILAQANSGDPLNNKIRFSHADVTEQQKRRIFSRCAAIYFLFGFTYVIYVTFFVTALVQSRGFSEHGAGVLWSWVGLLSLGSGPIFGYLSDRYGRKAGLVTVFCIQAAAYTLAITVLPEYFLYLSIFCFGIVAWSVPSIMAALVGDYAGPEKTASVFGFVTFIFGIGQIAGPFCAGLLAESTQGFTASFIMAAVLAVAAVALSAGLPGKRG